MVSQMSLTWHFDASIGDGNAVFPGYGWRKLYELAVAVRRALHLNGQVAPKGTGHRHVQLGVTSITSIHCKEQSHH